MRQAYQGQLDLFQLANATGQATSNCEFRSGRGADVASHKWPPLSARDLDSPDEAESAARAPVRVVNLDRSVLSIGRGSMSLH